MRPRQLGLAASLRLLKLSKIKGTPEQAGAQEENRQFSYRCQWKIIENEWSAVKNLGLRVAAGTSMDRVNGWAEILRRLGDVQYNVRPSLFIHRRCKLLLETLPVLQHDPNRPEDVLKIDAVEDGVGGDDAADALRYLVNMKAREVIMRRLRGLRFFD